ncbi:MAG: 16S rRNA (guanine(527)-N(7))-methyltransferase RsmG [bacterium]|nr:16S rRNA (guanine(527)-N(7))-methyltransferase RsmG [bacterium]
MFQLYLNMILKWNKSVSLVSKSNEETLIEDHLIDSVEGLLEAGFSENDKIADLGSGNGFPAIPIKIMLPGAFVTMIESNKRKASFLLEVLRELGLKNGEVLCKRIEECDLKDFDKITARAFKPAEEIQQILNSKHFCGEVVVWEKRSGKRVSKYHCCNVEKL